MINRLISFLLFFIFTLSFSFNNEIKGKFVYDIDINKNELYLFNNKLELNTYDLETGLLKYSRQIDLKNQDQLNNRTWGGLYSGNVNLSPDVMNGLMDNLTLKKLDNGEFYLFHNGGGLVVSLENNELNRVDNSFPFMNKFFGDFVNYNDKIFHFGGYGLFRSNNTMLLFDEGNSNQWDEVTFENNIPSEIKNGLASFFPLLIDSDYYILSGNSSFNNERVFNKSILKFDFKNYTWDKLGEINLDLSANPLIIPSETCFYVFDKDFFYQVQILKGKMLKFDYNRDFNNESLELVTNFEYSFVINEINTIKLINFEDTLIPIVHVRDNIEGFFNRSTYYNLINFALENNNIIDDILYISSGNKNYPVGKIA